MYFVRFLRIRLSFCVFTHISVFCVFAFLMPLGAPSEIPFLLALSEPPCSCLRRPVSSCRFLSLYRFVRLPRCFCVPSNGLVALGASQVGFSTSTILVLSMSNRNNLVDLHSFDSMLRASFISTLMFRIAVGALT